jgi:hypothetical protein
MYAEAQTARFGPLSGLLPDWRISLRARGRSLATIASYLSVGESFTEYMVANGVPDQAATVAREHVDLRFRGRHDAAEAPPFWLGKKGRMTDSGVRQMLERRCGDAGIPPVHPHQFRRTFARRRGRGRQPLCAGSARARGLRPFASVLARCPSSRLGCRSGDAQHVRLHQLICLPRTFLC